jgi:hypothetical protein
MNRASLKSGLLGLGLVLPLAVIAACSAESSTPAGGNGNTGNTGNTGGSNANTGGTGTSAGTSNTLPTGGRPPGSAGTGGIPAAAGTSAGGNPGTGGTGAGVTACTNKPAPAVGLIDDAEDGDHISALASALMTGSYWFTYNDTTGTQMPAPDSAGLNPLLPTVGGATTPMFSIQTKGSGFTLWGAGLGLTLNQDMGGGKGKCAVDASAYQGIKFQAKSAAGQQVRVKLGVPGTVGAMDGGTCAAMCDDFGVAVLLTTAWAEYQVPFAMVAQEGWGTVATFSAAQLLQIQFQVPQAIDFDFSIDDLTFY